MEENPQSIPDSQNPEAQPLKNTKKLPTKLILAGALAAVFLCILTSSILGAVYFFAKDKDNKSCLYNGKTYKNGENFASSDGCNTCSCSNGSVVCTEKACLEPTTSPTPEPTVSITNEASDTKPIINALYLATFNGKEVLFNTDATKQRYYENGTEKTSVYYGDLSYFEGSGEGQFDFRKLNSPKKLYTFDRPFYAGSPFYSADKKILFISVAFTPKAGENKLSINHIYSFDLGNKTATKVWENKSDDFNFKGYGDNFGEAFIYTVSSDNKYMAIGIPDCRSCDALSTTGVVILNIQTKVEKYIGEVGNIKFENNKVTYQKLQPTRVKCEEGPGCDPDGTMEVYKPAGPVLSTTLP